MSTSDNNNHNNDRVPKAILYHFPDSVWSRVPLLCLYEKGYSEDEYIERVVDLSKGENFAPSYLKINKNGTVPTLVVPTAETTSSDVDSRYRSLRDTITICDFLDQARSANTQNTVSDRPAPALAPATIEGKAIADEIIALVHLPDVDPNFLTMSARDEKELSVKSSQAPGEMVRDRRTNLEKHIAEAKQVASSGGSFDVSAVKFLEARRDANDSIYKIYNREADPEDLKKFYDASQKIWQVGIPNALERLETLIQDKGPFTLGDQVSLADLHVLSWFARLITVAGGKLDAFGVDTLEAQWKGKPIGPKVRAFWAAWLPRESFKKVVLAHSKF